MLTPRQIRAARGLLGWEATELGKRTNLSRETIANIESERTQPREGSLERIAKAFDDAGVDFTDNEGVRLKSTGVDVYEGPETFDKFYQFLYEHLRDHSGEVCLYTYDETLPAKFRKNPEIHRKRMKELIDRGDVTFRVLATISDFITHGYVQFKWLPQQQPTPTGFYAFGECLALLSFVNPKSPYIVVIKSAPLAEAYRQSFEVAWQNADEPPRGAKS